MQHRGLQQSTLLYPADSPKHLGNHASFMSDNERFAMNWIVHLALQVRNWEVQGGLVRPPRIFEIGTFWGLSLVEFSRMVSGSELHSLNILPEQVEGEPVQGEVIPKDEIGWYARSKDVRYKQYFGDSRFFDYQSVRDPFDVIFIDGRHDTEYVLSDTRKTRPLLADGGVMAWHDFHLGQVPVNTAEAIRRLDREDFDGALTHIEGTSLVYWVKPAN